MTKKVKENPMVILLDAKKACDENSTSDSDKKKVNILVIEKSSSMWSVEMSNNPRT